jgi:hypothetical protein
MLAARTATPVGKASVRELDLTRRRLLGSLLNHVETEQDAPLLALSSKEDPVAVVCSLRSHLVDLAPKMTGDAKTAIPHVLHRGVNLCCVTIGETVDDLVDHPPSGTAHVEAPAPLHPPAAHGASQ